MYFYLSCLFEEIGDLKLQDSLLHYLNCKKFWLNIKELYL